ncbi:hypothetical protein LTS18_002590 [Coniosporium uncinatum]|uniref:Uncharacterized protein n=1 Tax=Coniosporium uncinatum TaxID=93489 RepID=A0ACC3CS91_9PEZI|nr:hypothetical protein LTS18_002590 [Coniosporium uncinatum]
MQEMWLFGQLNTLGRSKLEQETEEDAKVVQSLLERVVKSQGAAGQSDEETTKK